MSLSKNLIKINMDQWIKDQTFSLAGSLSAGAYSPVLYYLKVFHQ